MFETYKIMKQNDIISGQEAKSKEWYCKELPTKTTKETERLIGELNKIYNKANKAEASKKKKEEEPNIKGLK